MTPRAAIQDRVSPRPNPLVVLFGVQALLALVGLASSPATVGCAAAGRLDASDARDRVALAVADGRRGDAQAALAALRTTARGGDRAAREVLGVLLLAGPPALRVDNAAGPRACEALGWLDLAASQGSDMAAAYLGMLSPAERSFVRGNCVSAQD